MLQHEDCKYLILVTHSGRVHGMCAPFSLTHTLWLCYESSVSSELTAQSASGAVGALHEL